MNKENMPYSLSVTTEENLSERASFHHMMRFLYWRIDEIFRFDQGALQGHCLLQRNRDRGTVRVTLHFANTGQYAGFVKRNRSLKDWVCTM